MAARSATRNKSRTRWPPNAKTTRAPRKICTRCPLPQAPQRRPTQTSTTGDDEHDVSYLTMVVPDLDAALAFYGGVFGWTCNMGSVGGAQVTGVAP